jgi:acylaminoacyl-peptidase
MILRTAVTLLISSMAMQLNAAPLDKGQIQFIGPIKTHTNIKPNNTAYQAQIIQSLLPSLQKQADSLQVFGKKT